MSNGHFTVSLSWEIEDGVGVDLVVTGAYATGGGNRSGHPDTWTEAWTELEIGTIENEHGCGLPGAVVKQLKESNSFREAVINKLKR